MATSWTDPTLTANSTPAKAVHQSEIRTAIASERTRRSLDAYTFRDSIAAGGARIKLDNVSDIRQAVGFAPLSLTDPNYTAQIPLMTTNSNASGYPTGTYTASASSVYSTTNIAWNAFDKNRVSGASWRTANAVLTGSVQLQYPSAVTAVKYELQWNGSTNYSRFPKNFTFQGSTNGTDWTTLDTVTNASVSATYQSIVYDVDAGSQGAYNYYRLNVTANNGSTTCLELGQLIIYEANYVENPQMTANSTTTGNAFAIIPSTIYSSTYHAGNVANSSLTDYWYVRSGLTVGWLKVLFPHAMFAKSYSISVALSVYLAAPKAWTFEGSNDGTTWVTLDTQTLQTGWNTNGNRTYSISPATAYRWFRLNVTENNSQALRINTFQVNGVYEVGTEVLPIKKVHIEEMRTKVNALENCTTTGTTGCNSGCTGLCVSCAGGCTDACTGCTDACTGCSSACTGDASCTCVPAGTLILMEDFSQKKIEEIQIGEKVIGLDNKPHTVTQLDLTHLGGRSLLKFTDGSLRWSEEHLMWTKFKDGHEYWGTWGMGQYLRELEMPPTEYPAYGLRKRLPDLCYQPNTQFAHVDGWRTQNVVVDHSGYNEMLLYNLVTDGHGSMIANGYVIGAFVSDENYDFNAVKWEGLKRD